MARDGSGGVRSKTIRVYDWSIAGQLHEKHATFFSWKATGLTLNSSAINQSHAQTVFDNAPPLSSRAYYRYNPPTDLTGW